MKIKDLIRTKTIGQSDSTASASIKANDNFNSLKDGLTNLLTFLNVNDTDVNPFMTVTSAAVLGNIRIGSVNALTDAFSVNAVGGVRSASINTNFGFLGKLVIKPTYGVVAAIEAGEIRFDGTSFSGYNGTTWIDFAGGSAFSFGFPNIVPLGTTVTVGPNHQIFVYGNLIVRGTLINNGEIVCANGNVTIDGGTFNQNGTTTIVNFAVV